MHALGKVEYEITDGEVVYAKGGTVGVMLTEPQVGTSEPTLRDLSEGLIAVYGTDYGIHSPTWISRFTDATRQAAAYRDGRVLLAGDAAHMHSPVGGQGLNIGRAGCGEPGLEAGPGGQRDLAGQPAGHVPRRAPPGRRRRAAQDDGAGRAACATDDRTKALRETVAELLSMDEPRRRFGAKMSGLDIHYDLGEGHPLLGRRMPDLDLVTDDGPLRVFSLLHEARPVLLDLGEPGASTSRRGPTGFGLSTPAYAGPWELPAIGSVRRPRPSSFAPTGTWRGWAQGTQQGLVDALTVWFGPPADGVAGWLPRPGSLRSTPSARLRRGPS